MVQGLFEMTANISENTGLNLSDSSSLLNSMKTELDHLMSLFLHYTAPYQTELTWILPSVALFLFIILVFIRLKRKPRKPSPVDDVNTPAEQTDSEPLQKTSDDTDIRKSEEPVTEPEPEPDISEATIETEKPSGILKNIRSGLSKTRKALSSSVDKIFSTGGKLDGGMLEDLEEILITSDVGVKTSLKIIESLSEKASDISDPEQLKAALKNEIFNLINVTHPTTSIETNKPHVMMVVGVNGVGKTTTIGKLAARLVREDKKVLIVAADTFRAAASSQLAVWAERSGADIVRHKDNSDPAAVAYDGIEAAISRGVDVVIIDTAGRLHTKKNLMEELKKIKRTVDNKLPGSPHETLMVVDATTGQNALQQAQLFHEAIGITDIALTKLDGTAKGGIVIGITNTLNIGLKYVGVGEQIDDLQDFDPKEFADAIL